MLAWIRQTFVDFAIAILTLIATVTLTPESGYKIQAGAIITVDTHTIVDVDFTVVTRES